MTETVDILVAVLFLIFQSIIILTNSCVYGINKWSVKPLINEWDPELKLQGAREVVHLEFTSKSRNILPIYDSANFPQVSNLLPMRLINIMAEKIKLLNFLRNRNGVYYKSFACDLNIPRTEELGDMQIDLNKKNSVHPTWAVHCKIEGESVMCSTAGSGYHET